MVEEQAHYMRLHELVEQVESIDPECNPFAVVSMRLGIDERHFRMTYLRYNADGSFNRTLQSIGKDEGVSRQRVLQIVSKTMRRLRGPTHPSCLRDFLKEEEEE